MNAALVPVKRLAAGKSRMEGVLDAAGTRALALAMLGDVVEALRATREVDHVAVVTPDPEVGDQARALGAEPLVRDDPGLNAALDAGGAALAARGARSLLVVLGDVAGADPADLSALYRALEALGERGAVLAAARDGGTAALLRRPPAVLPNRFGPASAAAHARAAAERGVPFRALQRASLAVDLDRPEDLRALREGSGPAPRTRALLAGLGEGAP